MTIKFDKLIAYGDTSDRDAWIVQRGPTRLPVALVSIPAGRIRLSYLTFIGPATTVEFVGPPPIFRDTNNAILESFISPVPFP